MTIPNKTSLENLDVALLKNEIAMIQLERERFVLNIERLQYKIINLIEEALRFQQQQKVLFEKKFHFAFIRLLLQRILPNLAINQSYLLITQKIKYLTKLYEQLSNKSKYSVLPQQLHILPSQLAPLVETYNILIKQFEKKSDKYGLSVLQKKEKILQQFESNSLSYN